MCDHAGLEIVADDTERNAAEILKHMDITADPCLFVHIQARLNIRKLAVWKYRHKEIDGIRLTFFGIVKAHRFTAPVYFAYNTGLVRDVIGEVVLLDILGIIITKLCVSDRNADLHTVLVLLPQQLERHACLLQFTVDILIVDRCVHSFLSILVRKEEQIDLVVTLVCQIRKADTQFSGTAAYSSNRLGGDVPRFNDLTLRHRGLEKLKDELHIDFVRRIFGSLR